MAARVIAICAVFFGTLSPNDAIILCRDVHVVCKRSDRACYSGPCALVAPDLYTIIDDDLADDLVYKPAPRPAYNAVPLIPPQSVSQNAFDAVPRPPPTDSTAKQKPKVDAAGDYLNAPP